MSRRYVIETRTAEVDDPLAYVPASEWSRDNLGEDARTTYPSRAAAERQIKALRKLGGEWAEREYRARGVRPSEGRPEAERERVVVSLRLSRGAIAALDAGAETASVSRSAWVERLALK